MARPFEQKKGYTMNNIKVLGAYKFKNGSYGFVMNTPKGRHEFVGSKQLLLKEVTKRMKKLAK